MVSRQSRMVISILSSGYLLLAVLFFNISLGWFTPVDHFDYLLLDPHKRWVLGFISFLVFLFSLFLLFENLRTKQKITATIHQTALGQIEITIPALEALVCKAVQTFKEIDVVKPILELKENKLTVVLKIKVNPDLDIPQTTAELQHVIKDYITETTGTSIHTIKVEVAQINS